MSSRGCRRPALLATLLGLLGLTVLVLVVPRREYNDPAAACIAPMDRVAPGQTIAEAEAHIAAALAAGGDQWIAAIEAKANPEILVMYPPGYRSIDCERFDTSDLSSVPALWSYWLWWTSVRRETPDWTPTTYFPTAQFEVIIDEDIVRSVMARDCYYGLDESICRDRQP